MKDPLFDEMISRKKNPLSKQRFNKFNINLTDKQKELYNTIRKSTLTIVSGPSGTSKTFSSCYTALSLLADGKVNNIIITKPLIESGDKTMGFLPGSLEEKILPHFKSYYNIFEKILGKELFKQLIGNIIKVESLNFMRGETYDRSIMLLDECQNTTMTDIMLLITRLGENSKAVMMGDVSQYDIKGKDAKFLTFQELMDGVPNISNFKFNQDDIVRNELLKTIVDRYEKLKYKN